MAIRYKVDIVEQLKIAGYSSYRIRKEKIMGEGTLQRLRKQEPITFEALNVLCELLNCQPGDILEYISEKS